MRYLILIFCVLQLSVMASFDEMPPPNDSFPQPEDDYRGPDDDSDPDFGSDRTPADEECDAMTSMIYCN